MFKVLKQLYWLLGRKENKNSAMELANRRKEIGGEVEIMNMKFTGRLLALTYLQCFGSVFLGSL